jgi:hypothetical protein
MELEQYTPLIVLAILVWMFGFLGFVLWRQKYHPRFPDPTAELAATGLPAQGVILEAEHASAGVGVNELIIGLTLEVRPDGRPAYRAKTFKKVSLLMLHRYEVGARVKVLLDPKDPSRVGVVGFEQSDVDGTRR